MLMHRWRCGRVPTDVLVNGESISLEMHVETQLLSAMLLQKNVNKYTEKVLGASVVSTKTEQMNILHAI